MNRQLKLKRRIRTDYYELHAVHDSIFLWLTEAEGANKMKIADLFCYFHLASLRPVMQRRIEKLEFEGKIITILSLSPYEIICLRKCLQANGYNFYLTNVLAKVDQTFTFFNHFIETFPSSLTLEE